MYKRLCRTTMRVSRQVFQYPLHFRILYFIMNQFDIIITYKYDIYLDTYIGVKGISCRRRLQDRLGIDREFTIQNAKHECSKNMRCVGIASNGSNIMSDLIHQSNFLCLDSVHKNIGWDDYGKWIKQVLRKATPYGKCTTRKSTQYWLIKPHLNIVCNKQSVSYSLNFFCKSFRILEMVRGVRKIAQIC